jgi:hypothetical protein
MNWFGLFLCWLLAAGLVLCFPMSEFARGMASNPAAHKPSAAILSIIGVALIALLDGV